MVLRLFVVGSIIFGLAVCHEGDKGGPILSSSVWNSNHHRSHHLEKDLYRLQCAVDTCEKESGRLEAEQVDLKRKLAESQAEVKLLKEGRIKDLETQISFWRGLVPNASTTTAAPQSSTAGGGVTPFVCNEDSWRFYYEIYERNLAGCNLANANLEGANFSFANLVGANLTNANCRGASFFEADLTGADLSGGDFYFANFQTRDPTLYLTKMVGAKMTGATAAEAGMYCDFTDANLTGTDFSSARMVDSKFLRADITNVRFTGSSLFYVNLTGAVGLPECWYNQNRERGATFNFFEAGGGQSVTICPNGSNAVFKADDPWQPNPDGVGTCDEWWEECYEPWL